MTVHTLPTGSRRGRDGMRTASRTLPAGIVYPINPVMARSDLAGARTGMHTPRTLPTGIALSVARIVALAPVVAYFHNRYQRRAGAGHHVGDQQRPVPQQYPLYHEKQAPESHQQKRRHCYAIRVIRTYRIHRLRQIPEYHTHACQIPYYLCYHNPKFLYYTILLYNLKIPHPLHPSQPPRPRSYTSFLPQI